MVSDLNDPTVERLAARLHHQSPLRSGVADNGKAGDGHLRRFRKIALGFALCVLDTRPCGRRCTHAPALAGPACRFAADEHHDRPHDREIFGAAEEADPL